MQLELNFENKTWWGILNELIQQCREKDVINKEEYSILLQALDKLLKG